jgi:hypothetical protein
MLVADSPTKSDDSSAQTAADERRIEELTRELASRLRAMPNRTEMTDFAVSMLRESAEDADHAEQARISIEKAGRGDAFNPIAFAIPLFVIGAVLCATGILIGPGLGIIGIALLMGLYGLGVAMFSRRGTPRPAGRVSGKDGSSPEG